MIGTTIVGVALISSGISTLATKIYLDKNKKPPKQPTINPDMQAVLDNNNYTPYKEWRENNVQSLDTINEDGVFRVQHSREGSQET